MVFSFSLVAFKYQTSLYFRLQPLIRNMLSILHGTIVATNIILFFILAFVDANSLSLSLPIRIIGSLLFAFGSYTLIWAAVLLKPALIHPSPVDEIITSGPFRWSRHPMYFGGIVGAFGISLHSASLFALIYSVLQVIILYTLAITEERDLKLRFGKKYENYSRNTPRLFPSFRLFRK